MKSKIFIILTLGYFSTGLFAQVGINTTTPNAKSALDITSTTQGFLPPRMTESQRNAITNPIPTGLIVWCIDCGNYGQLQAYNGSFWADMTGGIASQGPFNCGTSMVTFFYNGSPVIYGTVLSAGKCWLDRNLGASQVATSSTDINAYGDLFQWGRGDDSHQIRTSGTTITLSATDNPGHGNFILAPSFPYDWRSPQNTNLWQGVTGINNPCPTGYRLPTSGELDIERLSWGGNQNALGAFNSPLKLPVPGVRSFDDGTLYEVGSYGVYWSSSVDLTYSRNQFFDSGTASIQYIDRAYGLSVRCIKD